MEPPRRSVAPAPRRLRSARLSGRPFERRDWPLVLEILSHPTAGRWLTAPGFEAGEARARRIAGGFAESWSADGFGPYVWALGPSPLGYAGLRRTALDGVEAIEALWAMRPEYWGRGYATEAAEAAIEADGAGREILSWTRPDNAASLRVMAKLGFGFSHEASRAGLAHAVYRRAGDQES